MSDTTISRLALATKLGTSFGTNRSLYSAVGYPTTLTYSDYFSRFERQEVARRIVTAPVSATWRVPPRIEESHRPPHTPTEFESGWEELVTANNIFEYIRRTDILAGVGRFAVLLLGISDSGEELQSPLLPTTLSGRRRLLYLAPYSEDFCCVLTLEPSPSSPRWGLPALYQITTNDRTFRVHHSRVIHVADGLLEDETYGTPRLKCIYNRLQDLETIVAGSAEMFWQGAFPGTVYSMDKDADPSTQTIAEMDEEISRYIHKLRRYMKLQGVTPHQLSPNIADPTQHAMIQLKLISAGTGIPMRILLGSERGELASSQDEKNWNSRIDERRTGYGERLLRSLVDRLIYCGVLPTPTSDYMVEWPDVFALSEEDRAKIAKLRAETLFMYSNSGMEDVYPYEYFLRNEMGLTTLEVEQILSRFSSSSPPSPPGEEPENSRNRFPATESSLSGELTR